MEIVKLIAILVLNSGLCILLAYIIETLKEIKRVVKGIERTIDEENDKCPS